MSWKKYLTTSNFIDSIFHKFTKTYCTSKDAYHSSPEKLIIHFKNNQVLIAYIFLLCFKAANCCCLVIRYFTFKATYLTNYVEHCTEFWLIHYSWIK